MKHLRRKFNFNLKKISKNKINNYDKINSYSTTVIAFATTINIIISIFLWSSTKDAVKLSQKSYEAYYRPYLGVWNTDPQINDSTKIIELKCEIKNFGLVPAKIDSIVYAVIINADTLRVSSNSSLKAIFPSMTGRLVNLLNAYRYEGIMTGKDSLKMEVNIIYSGVSEKKYFTKERYLFISSRKEFLNIDTFCN